MGTSIFMLILWPVVIYVCYKFIMLNITHTEKQEKQD
ncbi:hypothetical protein HELA111659_06075 [Helicobacter labetoulli]|uniref:Uncharacterized protein n=2 Tax=Helicobacter cinaedi TaxID=213 RepID=A0A377JQU4_9HELI|nr:hypothetical protein Hc94105_0031 [Helicobacter cinaedi]STP10194.1 Uncharacterised protein [Helicobacter cinaedi]